MGSEKSIIHSKWLQKTPKPYRNPFGTPKKKSKFFDFDPQFRAKSAISREISREKILDDLPKKNSNSALSRQIFKKIKFCKKNRKDVPKCYPESTLRPPRASCSARNRPRLFFVPDPPSVPHQLISAFGTPLSWPSELCRPPAWDQKSRKWP